MLLHITPVTKAGGTIITVTHNRQVTFALYALPALYTLGSLMIVSNENKGDGCFVMGILLLWNPGLFLFMN